MRVNYMNSPLRSKMPGFDGPHAMDDNLELAKNAREAGVNPYIEEEPSVKGWLMSSKPTRETVPRYFQELFPCATWITRYNLDWLIGDTIAGLTVGFVVVPQAMAYALLAGLPPEYGLYTSFTGAALYWVFGTSKDIVIGTTAVGSLLVGNVISSVQHNKPGVYTNEQIAKGLSFLSGVILLGLGLLRLGWLIELIPHVPISAFVTSASITIISTQLPSVLGISGINTREAPYRVYINTLKSLPHTKLDAAIGITSIVLLFAIREVCLKMEARRAPKQRIWTILSSLRLTFTVLLYTFISWLVHRKLPHEEKHWKFKLVGKIESGFKHAGPPPLDAGLFRLVAPNLPAIMIILIIEHIAIAKSFGRQYGYTVNPSQEILAQGASNAIGTLLGGYACTGSFGASAVLTKAGVRTPLAGAFSAIILLLALYALTTVFYYIPRAALAGLIIHAVSNLVTPPKALYKYWKLSPLELLIWVIGVVIALFKSLETSIYATIALSFAMLFIRIARPHGVFLGYVNTHTIVHADTWKHSAQLNKDSTERNHGISTINLHTDQNDANGHKIERGVYLPLDRDKRPNPSVKVVAPHRGVFIYRFEEPLNYVNAARHMNNLLSHILVHTRRTRLDKVADKDRLWSDPISRQKDFSTTTTTSSHPWRNSVRNNLPLVRAIILDCSAINHLDITSIQSLVDIRNTLDRYATPSTVEWHFACLHNRWTRKALSIAGFGRPTPEGPDTQPKWCPDYSVVIPSADKTDYDTITMKEKSEEAENKEGVIREEGRSDCIYPSSLGTDDAVTDEIAMEKKADRVLNDNRDAGNCNTESTRMEPICAVDRPFFHSNLADAVNIAMKHAVIKDSLQQGLDPP